MGHIPEEIKKQRGTYRKDRDQNSEVKFDYISEAKVPTFLKGEAKKNFKLMVDQLGANGYKMLTSMDVTALSLLCDSWGEYVALSRLINKEGYIIEDYNNRNKLVKKINPLVGQKRQLFKDILSMLNEFGMTPKSRSKVKLNTDDEGGDDGSPKLTDFFNN